MENQQINETVTAPAYQASVFVVMWKSNRSGGTYSQIRRSKESLSRFLDTLDYLGFDMNQVTISEQHKPWVPVKKAKEKRQRRPDRGVKTLLEV